MKYILDSLGINFNVTLANVLNIGDYVSDKAIMTIVADINNFNLNKTRPVNVTEAQIRQRIITLVSNEKSHAFKNNSTKKFYKTWRRFIPLASDN
jgi:hypothetical protein